MAESILNQPIVKNCVAIGDGASATQDNQFVIKTQHFSGEVIMTDAEAYYVLEMLKRMKFTRVN